MHALNPKLVRGIFGVLVASALGFGATHALARPVQDASPQLLCSTAETAQCNNYCAATLGEGRCTKIGGVYNCKCVYN
jgi:hypothetical protein